MLFKLNEKKKSLEPLKSDWIPLELELESYLISTAEEGAQVLSEAVFGEPLLLISNQVRTRAKKRADILALDRSGNGVIIELKREEGSLGVETQALQYLADFSAYQGIQFIKRFAKSGSISEDIVLSFVGDDAKLEDINKCSRVILMARSFDETVYSIGEWLSSKGIAFRCITYTPVEISKNKLLSFSVVFDQSPNSLYRLNFAPTAREPAFFWHNIARPKQEWWKFLVQNQQIPACFSNSPGDQGEKILNKYISGDIVVAYATGYGAVGWCKIDGASKYRLIRPGDSGDFLDGQCRHRLKVKWQAAAKELKSGISAEIVRQEFGIHHPISTSVKMNSEDGKRLIDYLSDEFRV